LAFLRGGNWNNGANAGAFTLNLNNAPSNTNTNIGFRCVASYVCPLKGEARWHTSYPTVLGAAKTQHKPKTPPPPRRGQRLSAPHLPIISLLSAIISPMEFVLLLLVIVIFVLAIGFFFLYQKLSKLERSEGLMLKFEETTKGVSELKGSLGTVHERLHSLIADMGGMKEISRQIQEFQDSLRSTKVRGGVGEMVMEDLLRQVLPASSYERQYTFRTTRKMVDAVIKTRQGLIPVDAKFPLEKFQALGKELKEVEKERLWREFVRDVKLRMDETAGYIVPEEGTVPFALMYIPFDQIFNQVVADPELMRYSLEKRVFFTSPQTFLVTIQSILLGLQRERFSEQAEEVLKMLHAVGRDAEDLDATVSTLARHVTDAKNTVDKLSTGFSVFLGKLSQLRDFKVKSKTKEEGE